MKIAGAVLRMFGVLVELACLTLLFRPGLDRQAILGIPLRSALYGGFFFGFLLVAAGLLLSWPRKPVRRREW